MMNFFGMYSTYVLLQADSACKNVHGLVHDVVPQKRYVLQGTYHFGSFVIFKMVCPSSVFFFGRSGRRPSSSGHVPRGTCSCICTCFVRTWSFTIACAIAFSDRVHDCMNDLFDRSRVRTPGLARDRFLWVQGLNPCPCSTIFSWVQGSIPWPWSPVFRPGISLAYVTRPHEWSNRWHRRTKKTLLRGKKKLVCLSGGPCCMGK